MINYMSAWVSIADMKKDYLTFFYMKMSNYMSPTNMRERQKSIFWGPFDGAHSFISGF